MSLAIRMVLLTSLLAVPAANGDGSVKGQGDQRSFVSVKYGFSMSVPPGWSVSTALDTPVYFFASSSDKFVQDRIPRGGAIIAMEGHDATSGLASSAKTPRAWAAADAQAETSGTPLIEPLEMPKASGASGAVETSYDEETFSPDQRKKHCVAVFWKFGGELFVARLRFNAGDSIGPQVIRVFLETVRSIKPLSGTSGH